VKWNDNLETSLKQIQVKPLRMGDHPQSQERVAPRSCQPAPAFPLAFPDPVPTFLGMDQLNIAALLKLQRSFVAARKWEKFHTPKNLSMALAGEAAELMEIFQWLTEAESKRVMKQPRKAKAVSHELADIFYYLLRIADTLHVDLETVFREKMRHNQAKYPVKLAKGNAKKYHEFLVSKGLNAR
jgi:NTP pyrophosphatase (non-canonical NTP hydrolase)